MSAFSDKYHVGRYLIWLWSSTIIFLLVTLVLDILFHPPLWLLLGALATVILFTPNPRWVYRK